MKILVVGATGATGRLLVAELLKRDVEVRAVARSSTSLPEELQDAPNLKVIEGSLLDFDAERLQELVADCDGIASCLGHNLSFKGIYGPPFRLVTEATRRLCNAAKASNAPARFVLMNTIANRNRDLHEPIPTGHKIVISLLRALLPPHRDNEQAADFLRTEIGQNDPLISWSAVRPDSLIDYDAVSPYDLVPSPTRSAIFNPGKTSRINVAHFMAELLTNCLIIIFPFSWHTFHIVGFTQPLFAFK